ncbi:hypothetical protein TRFO_41671 [Tritrichomonas foetus]|uniref:Rhodanese domain-containing protein n=1 Tax=Tritrichomonas foetus TaxID=1144522 RepID=A0A1J4L3W6_9EUKA|nr:hypothetical protein TRFO_41671 [Tritrichomonas foetus]|eukprot:OHT16668.1 hypothetical protein TRFO_41671 [Tritrichomonas foetus]
MVNFTNGIDPKIPMKSTSLEGQLFRQSNISLSLTEDLEIYQYNRSHPSNASSEFCAYSKNVSLLKDDQENPLKKSVLFDVISIPPVYYIETEMTREECKEIMRKRITRIFHVEIEHRKQYLILGAFGCGRSNNNPYDVASIFLDLIKEFHDYFKYIIFPIPSSDNNQIFSEVLHEVTQKPLPHEQKTQQSDYPAFRSVKGFGSNNNRISNKTLSQILSNDIKSFGFNKIEMIDARSQEAFYRMNIKGSVNMPLEIANPHKTKLHTQHITSIQEIYEKFYDKDTMMIILTKYCDIDSEIIVNQIKEIHKNSSQRELPLHIFILIGGVNKVYFQRKDLCNFYSQYIVPSNQLVESRLDFTGLFRRVSPTRFSKIYLNYATLGFSCLYVVDCRSPREFIAGHIKGAINCHPYTMNISELYEKIYKKNGIYFFHCEFSHQRGQTGCLEFIEAHELHGRSQNEPLNAFVIHDGYGNFYNKFPDFCDGKYESEFM